MDARAYEGNFLCSFGPNNEAGGSRTTACHIDIPVRHCTVSLDGEPVVVRGKVMDGHHAPAASLYKADKDSRHE
ncbi:2,5-dihydroxypyridine 5,6-dioxygenase [compost metagenome]